MIEFIVITLGVFGGFIIGREYERQLLHDRLVEWSHELRDERERLEP